MRGWSGAASLLALLVAGEGYADSFRIDASTMGQMRRNTKDLLETPTNTYLGFGWVRPSANFSVETDGRYFRDLNASTQDADLYQAVLHLQPAEALNIDFGRQFISEGFTAQVIDGLRTELLPPGYVGVTAYSGIPRTVERGDFNANDGLLTGLSIGLKEIPRTEVQLHTAWQKHDILKGEVKTNDAVLLGANLSHQWRELRGPMLYGLMEYDATAKVIETGTAGLDLTPAKRLSLNLAANYFNVNRETSRPTILGLFTEGETLEGRAASTWTVISDRLDLVQSYSYQRVEIEAGQQRSAHLLDTALPLSFEGIGLLLEPGYSFGKSFGGTVHAGRLLVHEELSDRIFIDAVGDVATYNKITQDNDVAVSSSLQTGYEIVKGWTLQAGVEFNRNNLLEQEVRGLIKIDYHDETKS